MTAVDFRPNDVMQPDQGWRYVGIVGSDVEYGSQYVRHDRPELQNFQNILMNGGVCWRRAFFGRFILRCFGIPTIARPSRGRPIRLPTEATGLIAGRQFAPGSREANNAGGRAGVPNRWPPAEHRPGMERPRP
jgi:hypothetical protein